MKNLSPKLKLLIIGAIALVLLLVGISIGQIIAINKKQKQIDELNKKLENLVNQIAGTNPPSSSSNITFVSNDIVVEVSYDN